MAYDTGTATTPGNLLVKLFDFAALNGWIIDSDISSDGQPNPYGSIHKNDVWITFWFDTQYIKLFQARGYTASGLPQTHPNSVDEDYTYADVSRGMVVEHITGPYNAYHFFEDEVYLHVVIDMDGLHYRHFGFFVFGIFNFCVLVKV